MNGPFLVLVGLMWQRLRLRPTSKAALFYLAAYWPAGATMPIAYQIPAGTETQEQVVLFLLFSCAFAMVLATLQIIWGLRGRSEVALYSLERP
jgi:hypothetical protein